MPTIQLKGGHTTSDPRLDRIPEFDSKSLQYGIRPLLAAGPGVALRNKTWRRGPILDQGREGACVGFGWTKELLCDPVPVTNLDNVWAQALYKQAQTLDDEPGEDYSGTSVLAGAKAVQSRGFMSEYRWAFGIDDVLATLSNFGPVVIGINWYDSMYETKKSGLVEVSGSIVGGHCICLTGHWPRRLMMGEGWRPKHVVEWTNSWGPTYGVNGRGYIEPEALEKLLKEGGDACVPVQRQLPS